MIGVSDKALSVCNDHYDHHAMEAHRCGWCPIESACRNPLGHGVSGLEGWRDRVNAAAEAMDTVAR